MPIESLQITDFRNLASIAFHPCAQGLNIIGGNNGSGKTSLLEAIHYLGLGRSFRSGSAARLIRQNANKFLLSAQILSDESCLVSIGLERELTGMSKMRMNEKDLMSVAALANILPIRVMHSQSHQLVESGPIFRRKFLDWGLFYHSAQFFPAWRNFERVLKQRNAILRDKKSKKELAAWTDELIKYGLALDAMRRAYIQCLVPLIEELTQTLLPLSNLSIHYHPGWDEHTAYDAILSENTHEDFRLGYTQFGPHRADIDISAEAVPIKHFLSRGQQKLFICAMILAQGKLLNNHTNRGLIYLVDDLPSELDQHSRRKLISLLSAQQTQVFVTAIHGDELDKLIDDKMNVPKKVFHVEHGRIRSNEL